MLELAQLAPSLVPALVIVAAAMLMLRQLRKMNGNGQMTAMSKRLDSVDTRLSSVEEHLAYLRGKVDAEATGRHPAVAEPAE